MCFVCRQFIVEQSTGCNDPEMLEKLYNHYLQPSAWKLTPGALDALAQIKLPGKPSSPWNFRHLW